MKHLTTSPRVGTKLAALGTLLSSAFLASGIYWAFLGTRDGGVSWILSLVLTGCFTAMFNYSVILFRKTNRGFRSALIFSAVVISGCWLFIRWVTGAFLGVELLLASLITAMLVSMTASWIAYGFTDETFIPSPKTIIQIEEIYRQQNPDPPSLPGTKRLFDVLLAAFGFVLSLPLWLAMIILIWLQDPGPILFIKHCSGYRGKPFRLYKFRTMKINAEMDTGPIASGDHDQRVVGVSKILRKTALDELPQLVNILLGEMSFVGPRPLRSVVEIENIQQIPGYTRRYNTLPGLAGLAQICGDNLLPPRDKLRYERIYAKHAGVLFDVKLLLIACLVVFYLRWTKDWDGRIPRQWIRFGG